MAHRLGEVVDDEAVLLGHVAVLVHAVADRDGDARVAQGESLGPALDAVAQYGDRLTLERAGGNVFVVLDPIHAPAILSCEPDQGHVANAFVSSIGSNGVPSELL